MSSIISKDLASQIAYKLTEKTKIVCDNLHLQYKNLVLEFYEKQTPKEIKELRLKYPDWLYTTRRISFSGHGFRYEEVVAVSSVVTNSHQNAILELTSAIADKIIKSKRKYEKAKEQYEQLKSETNQALLTLKTFSNIRKELPQAIPFLPPPISNSLVINLDPLKTKLDKQQEEKALQTSLSA